MNIPVNVHRISKENGNSRAKNVSDTGAGWLPQPHHLHSAGRSPASGSGRVWDRGVRGSRWNFENILCQNVRHDLEAFRWFYASETPIFKKSHRKMFRIGT